MEHPLFSVLIWANRTNIMYFRDALSSVAEQEYDRFELIILDDNPGGELEWIAGEFFPHDGRLIYKQLKKHEGRAYALNIGMHFAKGDYFVILGQHDRMSPGTLLQYASVVEHGVRRIRRFKDGKKKEIIEEPELIYCDQDETMGDMRTNPHFKGGFNKWLLLQDNYIGEFICLSRKLVRRVGLFKEGQEEADIYEYLLRCIDKNTVFCHVPMLLFHRRMLEVPDLSVFKQILKASYDEHVKVAKRYLRLNHIDGEIIPDKECRYWKIRLQGDDPDLHKNDYLLLKSREVRVNTGQSKKMMYAWLSQPDVGVVGVCFRGSGLTLDNCGYIFDSDGITFPACYGKPLFSDGYENRIALTQEVSMVDFSYCMIDKNVYQHLKGFRGELVGRDAVLDFCLRVRQSGYRIIYLADVVAREPDKSLVSTERSNYFLRERWDEVLKLGDPFYNLNLPMGLENYQLY